MHSFGDSLMKEKAPQDFLQLNYEFTTRPDCTTVPCAPSVPLSQAIKTNLALTHVKEEQWVKHPKTLQNQLLDAISTNFLSYEDHVLEKPPVNHYTLNHFFQVMCLTNS